MNILTPALILALFLGQTAAFW
jgi:S1/P1 Nuclease